MVGPFRVFRQELNFFTDVLHNGLSWLENINNSFSFKPVSSGGPQGHVPPHQTSVPLHQDLCISSTLCPLTTTRSVWISNVGLRCGVCSIMQVQRTFTYTQFYPMVILHKKYCFSRLSWSTNQPHNYFRQKPTLAKIPSMYLNKPHAFECWLYLGLVNRLYNLT